MKKSPTYKCLKCGEIVVSSEFNMNEQMKTEMETFDLFEVAENMEVPDRYDWWDGLAEDSDSYEHPCGCESGHNVRTYRDCHHEYDGKWWRCHCLIEHLLLKFEGGESNVGS